MIEWRCRPRKETRHGPWRLRAMDAEVVVGRVRGELGSQLGGDGRVARMSTGASTGPAPLLVPVPVPAPAAVEALRPRAGRAIGTRRSTLTNLES